MPNTSCSQFVGVPPGLVINEKVVRSGRIPSPAEITTFLANPLAVA